MQFNFVSQELADSDCAFLSGVEFVSDSIYIEGGLREYRVAGWCSTTLKCHGFRCVRTATHLVIYTRSPISVLTHSCTKRTGLS